MSTKKITEVVAALIWDGNRFMICQRPAHKARGLLWEFVGGKVEPGETKEAALIRECREELAVELVVGDKFMDVLHEYPDLTVHLTVFHASIASGIPQKLEHSDIQWITSAQILEYDFCPADVEILAKIKKLSAYRELLSQVRVSYEDSPSGLKWYAPCREINLWTYWQGRGNLDARIMLLGQDWGSPWDSLSRQTVANIHAINEGTEVPYLHNTTESPTDQNLIHLFREIGYDISGCANHPDLFFTNLVLGYREKGFSGGFRSQWTDHDAPFFAKLVEIIEPEIILCLGRQTFEGVFKAFPQAHRPRICGFNRFIESRDNPVILQLSSGKTVKICALAHCGRLGTMNRNRGAPDKTSLQKQIDDWKRIVL